MNKIIIFYFFPLLLISQTQGQKNDSNLEDDFFTMFYNVENLFDTINSPDTNDEEFLPLSKKTWNTERYFEKLSQLEKVFEAVKDMNDNKMPNIVGLSEVENISVIKDLLNTPIFNDHNYNIVHQESPDNRGIDCALLFDNKFKLLKSDFIKLENPHANRPTRDIVYSKLQFHDVFIHVFVNHWPSRWGGQEETNHKRVFAASVLKEYINTHIADDEHILIMGDFNDYPSNESLSDILVTDSFLNIMTTESIMGIGSYNYKGDWNWLDQIIVSKNLSDSNFNILSAGAFQQDFMLYKNSKGEIYPSRTFGGNNWYGGFSDHLPVFCKMRYTQY